MDLRKPRPSEVAWAGLVAGITAYEYLAPKGELLTDQAYRNGESENPIVKWGTRVAIGATALHLLNLLPRKIDPFVYLGKAVLRERE